MVHFQWVGKTRQIRITGWAIVVTGWAIAHAQPVNMLAEALGEGKFCPPLMFFGDIKTNRLIFTSFSVSDQNSTVHLLKKEVENRLETF